MLCQGCVRTPHPATVARIAPGPTAPPPAPARGRRRRSRSPRRWGPLRRSWSRTAMLVRPADSANSANSVTGKSPFAAELGAVEGLQVDGAKMRRNSLAAPYLASSRPILPPRVLPRRAVAGKPEPRPLGAPVSAAASRGRVWRTGARGWARPR